MKKILFTLCAFLALTASTYGASITINVKIIPSPSAMFQADKLRLDWKGSASLTDVKWHPETSTYTITASYQDMCDAFLTLSTPDNRIYYNDHLFIGLPHQENQQKDFTVDFSAYHYVSVAPSTADGNTPYGISVSYLGKETGDGDNPLPDVDSEGGVRTKIVDNATYLKTGSYQCEAKAFTLPDSTLIYTTPQYFDVADADRQYLFDASIRDKQKVSFSLFGGDGKALKNIGLSCEFKGGTIDLEVDQKGQTAMYLPEGTYHYSPWVDEHYLFSLTNCTKTFQVKDAPVNEVFSFKEEGWKSLDFTCPEGSTGYIYVDGGEETNSTMFDLSTDLPVTIYAKKGHYLMHYENDDYYYEGVRNIYDTLTVTADQTFHIDYSKRPVTALTVKRTNCPAEYTYEVSIHSKSGALFDGCYDESGSIDSSPKGTSRAADAKTYEIPLEPGSYVCHLRGVNNQNDEFIMAYRNFTIEKGEKNHTLNFDLSQEQFGTVTAQTANQPEDIVSSFANFMISITAADGMVFPRIGTDYQTTNRTIHLPAGSYNLTYNDDYSNNVMLNFTHELTVTGGQTTDASLDFQQAGQARFTFPSADGRSVYPNIAITQNGRLVGRHIGENADEDYIFIGNPGNYTFHATGDTFTDNTGFESPEIPFELTAGNTKVHTVKLTEPIKGINGFFTVYDEFAKELSGVRVDINGQSATTGIKGIAYVRGIEGDVLKATIQAEGRPSCTICQPLSGFFSDLHYVYLYLLYTGHNDTPTGIETAPQRPQALMLLQSDSELIVAGLEETPCRYTIYNASGLAVAQGEVSSAAPTISTGSLGRGLHILMLHSGTYRQAMKFIR